MKTIQGVPVRSNIVMNAFSLIVNTSRHNHYKSRIENRLNCKLFSGLGCNNARQQDVKYDFGVAALLQHRSVHITLTFEASATGNSYKQTLRRYHYSSYTGCHRQSNQRKILVQVLIFSLLKCVLSAGKRQRLSMQVHVRHRDNHFVKC